MDIPELLFTTLGPLVANRVYPNTFMQGDALPTWPAIRYTMSDTAFPAACGSEDQASDDVSVQIDVVAKTFPDMRTLKAAVIAALKTTNPPCERQFGFQTYDAETKTHRAVMTYLFQLTADPA